MKKHVVFGAGLIGCFVGGVIASVGPHLSLVCRESIRNKLHNGLILTDFKQNKVTVNNLQFIENDVGLDRVISTDIADVLWLTVKCTSVPQAVNEMAAFVSEKTIILCCQNGLGSDAVVRQAFPQNRVLRVMVPFNVAELSAGALHRGSDGALTIESSGLGDDEVQSLVNKLNVAVMPVASTQTMDELLWAKLQLNLGNSVNALADIPVKEMLQHRGYRLVIASMMRELLTVTDAKRLSLPKVTALPAHFIPKVLALPTILFKLVANKMLAIDPTVRTSMWWDLSTNKKTEIDFLNGAIVQHGKLLAIDCPVNSKIIELIKAAEIANQASIKRQAIQPNELLRLVNLVQ